MIDIQDIFNWLEAAGIKHKGTIEQKSLGLHLLNEEFSELWKGLVQDDKKEILDGMADLIWVCTNNLLFHNISLQEFQDYFKQVSKSNWSKFATSELEAISSVEAYDTGTHPDKPGQIINAYYLKVGDDLWGIFREDGKILKSINYEKL